MMQTNNIPESLSTELQQRIESVQNTLNHIQSTFFPAALASSLSIEDMVLTDLILRHSMNISIFTLDTGRMHGDTLDVIKSIEGKYNARIDIYRPSQEDTLNYINEYGLNGFYQSVALRQRCCEIRKVNPLRQALSGKKSWLTGQRRDQSITRDALPMQTFDHLYGLEKFNPLVDWNEQNVWDYIKYYAVPYNRLYDQGYPSIGCAPCTRPIVHGEDIRAGRWWWENPNTKECGLHIGTDGKLQSIRKT